ncbi:MULTISPECIES: cytochrome c [unclassified Roseitalea]|uniref:c-type cytochrome n=1 Tax=unclassified Roseitalea TaxID=2639107 RepID=UPI00273D51A6|nr:MULTISPECIES: cytochrome c [unclassified Roseitalea]
MKRMIGLAAGAAVAGTLGLAAIVGLAPGAADRDGLLRPGDAALVARGQALYAANCASCHGADLQGEPDWRTPGADGLMPAPPHDETGHTWHHPDRVLFAITKYGLARAAGLDDYRSAMPAYEDTLTDEQIIAILSYIKSTWPEQIRLGHDELNRRDAESRQ